MKKSKILTRDFLHYVNKLESFNENLRQSQNNSKIKTTIQQKLKRFL